MEWIILILLLLIVVVVEAGIYIAIFAGVFLIIRLIVWIFNKE